MSDTFPRQHARTQRLTLGEPRSFTISPDGARVLFTRSHHGSDPVNTLWVRDLATGTETEILDPRTVPVDTSTMTPEEARRRERAREGAGGIVSYACDATLSRAVTILGGQIVVVDLQNGALSMPPIAPGVFDARLSPDGTMLSYTRGGRLFVSSLEGNEQLIGGDDDPQITWGLAEFIAAEEMGRSRGYWWSPDSRQIAATRVDTGNIPTIAIADPATPTAEPVVHAYPFAGTTNATVSLHIIDAATGAQQQVDIPGSWEYLNSVSWTAHGLVVQVQSRDQRNVWIHRVDPATGACTLLATDTDTAWVELVPGTPTLDNEGRLVQCADRGGVRTILIDGEVVLPSTLQVRSVMSVAQTIVVAANECERPWSMQLYRYRHADRSLEMVSEPGGVNSGVANDACSVVRHVDLTTTRARFTVVMSDSSCELNNHAEEPLVSPRVRLVEVGPDRIPTAIITPSDDRPGPLPVLFDPYGGPHAQRVVESRSAHATSQWFADQGFVVVVADNIGTPGRGSAWERGVHGDLATPVLAHQVDVVRALADIEPRADISRVAIRGWSFGGYLAALAVLRRPDVFHAAIAGAPVTDWALYDTHYTERYLGVDTSATTYRSTSLLNDAARLNDAASLTRPLLLIHGLADDNVVAAHTLQLSSALLAAGKYHEVLPLSGVTHMTPQEVVAENLLLHQLQFLRRWLSLSTT